MVDSRSSGDGIRRRRVCDGCGRRFTTHERVEVRLPAVVKKDGTRELYSRDKVLAGLHLACRKRPISAEDIETACDAIERWAFEQPDAEIASEDVGRQVLEALRGLDKVAYLRFASVYLELETVDAFLDLGRELGGERA